MWKQPPSISALKENQVHLWRVDFKAHHSNLNQLCQLLSNDEKARAKRFLFEADHARYVIGRGILRTLLENYTKIRAFDILFEYGESGKPTLSHRHVSPLQFNISHAENIGLFGFTLRDRIGVDVEKVQASFPTMEIAQNFFSPQEVKHLQQIPHDKEQNAAFFRCWTRKEALIKALGGGLSIPLKHFSVSLKENFPVRLYNLEQLSETTSEWTLFSIQPQSGYIGAVAVNNPHSQLVLYNGNT